MLRRSVFFVVFAYIGLIGMASAQEQRGTKEEAVTLVKAAIEHVKKVGADQAWKDFTNDKVSWTKNDLYVLANKVDGTSLAHGVNSKLVGKNMLAVKDANGVEILKEFNKVVTAKGSGWVDYDWPHPQSKKVEAKSTYVQRVPGTDAYVGVGVYR